MTEFSRASYAKFATWHPASGPCAKVAQPGARALMAGILLRWPAAKNWGILSCRQTALGNMSAHAKGRALDVGCSLSTGRAIVRTLLRVGPSRLGISTIIHNRVIYSQRSPAGRRYGGVPHTDHVHIELTGKAAKRLTLRTVRRILAG